MYLPYQLLHNLNHLSRLNGAHVDDPFFAGHSGLFHIGDVPPYRIPHLLPVYTCGLFVVHNEDDRPDGELAPSLSVGDLIAFALDEGDRTLMQVDAFDASWFGAGTWESLNIVSAPTWRHAIETFGVMHAHA
jgi:hypothetical protein